MWTKLVAGTLFLTFVLFVNLAAAVATSYNRVETNTIASIATIFQLLVDVGAVFVIGFVGIRIFVKLANQVEMANRRQQLARQMRPTGRAAASFQPQSFRSVNDPGLNAQSPLPFDNHTPAGYNNQTVLQQQPIKVNEPEQGVPFHRMRQQRSNYRMVR